MTLPLVYILAASHSGSTLLAMLLAGHPDVCTVGELKLSAIGDPARYRCSCGEAILNCGFWTGIKKDLAARGWPFDVAGAGTDVRTVASAYARALLRPLHRGRALEWCRDAALMLSPAWRRGLRTIQARNAALVASLGERFGSRIVVDSSKTGVRLKYLLRNPALDVRVIRLLRDGRAVMLTYINPEWFADASDAARRGGGMGASRDGERLGPAAAARQWRRSVEEMAHAVARVPPDRRMDVRYEALCTDLTGVLRRIFEFIGVDFERWQPSFRSRGHHVVGNGMRFDTSSAVVLDDRWQTSLSGEERRTFEAVAGALNRQLGYR